MKRFSEWIPSLAAAAVGLCSIVAAFFVKEHDDVLAIIGVGLLLHPTVEWAIARRLEDFWARATMQSESFDAVWSGIRERLTTHERRLQRLERRVGLDELDSTGTGP